MKRVIQNIKKYKERCKTDKTFLEKVIVWIVFGVLASIFPIVFRAIVLLIMGYRFRWSDYLSDFLLVVFAVCINAVSIIISERKKISESTVLVNLLREGFMVLVVFSFYSIFLRPEAENENIFLAYIIFPCVAAVFLMISSYIGVRSIDLSNKDDVTVSEEKNN